MKEFSLALVLLFVLDNQNMAIAVEPMQASIQDVKNRHTEKLMSMPGVVSVGLGLDENKSPIIIIGIEKEDVELIAKLPQQLEGHRVNIQFSGKVRSQP